MGEEMRTESGQRSRTWVGVREGRKEWVCHGPSLERCRPRPWAALGPYRPATGGLSPPDSAPGATSHLCIKPGPH